MSHLVIDNVGPITHVEFDLTKVNIFIGPQSIGKSTVAKIISFCLWLEKYVLRQQHVDNINSLFMQNRLVSFHKMESYFDSSSRICYSGEAIEFDYQYPQEPDISKSKIFDISKVGKIAYVPAERNIVSMANINSYKLEDDYVRDFVFEWLSVRTKYPDPISIPGTDIRYYYDEKRGDVVLLGNSNKAIYLSESSSGIQSIVPLYMYCLYASDWVYHHSSDMSFEDLNKIVEGIRRGTFNVLRTASKSEEVFSGDKYEDNLELMTRFVQNFQKNENSLEFDEPFLSQFADRISRPHYTELIIEEPELNLFPETQIDLLFAILKLMQNNGNNKLVITTHSPYILYALNNCLLADLVRNNIPKEKFGLIKCLEVKLSGKDVSVFEIENGSFRLMEKSMNQTIQDTSGLVRQNFFDRVMKEIMNDFNALLTYRY